MVVNKKLTKKFLKASYNPGKKIPGNVYDHHLSGKRVSVYQNPTTGKATVIHRGTASMTDWFKTNLPMALGYEGGSRFKHAKKIQKKAEKKYGAQNVVTMGHSLGGRIAEKVGKKSSAIITYNKAATPKSILTKTPKKQQDIRTSGDLVSKLSVLQKHSTPTKTIRSSTINPIKAHNVNQLTK
jgi:hypothetical protein